MDFLRRGRLRREKKSNGGRGLLGQGKVGVGVGGERGGRYKLKYFTPISYPHIPGKREMLMRKGDKKDDSFTLSTSMKRKKGEEKGK